MGRSKQSARKFEGSTPMSQANCSTSTQFRTYMVSQQPTTASAGFGLARRRMAQQQTQQSSNIFVNYENTFSNFQFHRPSSTLDFQPAVQVGKVKNYGLDAATGLQLFMRLDFLSRFDGRADLLAETRPGLDAVFVLDVSGSMSTSFPDDSDLRSKLQVAIDGIRRIFSKITSQDRVALVTFNGVAKTLLPLTSFTPELQNQMEELFSTIQANGGTSLNAGLTQGFNCLPQISLSTGSTIASWLGGLTGSSSSPKAPTRIRRVFFLTDMESSNEDELEVIATAQHHAASSSYFTVVGIGVDLSATTVGRISSVPGSRYMSVVNAKEMHSTLVQDFEFDLAPIAYDIQVKIPEDCGITIQKCFGSSELHSLAAGIKSFTISSEFAMSLSAPETALGGLYLFQLATDAAKPINKDNVRLEISWKDPAGQVHREIVPLSSQLAPLLAPAADVSTDSPSHSVTTEQGLIVEIDNVSPGCDVGIRKAGALIRYVDTLTHYVTAEQGPSIPSSHSAIDQQFQQDRPYPFPVMQQQRYRTRYGVQQQHKMAAIPAVAAQSLPAKGGSLGEAVPADLASASDVPLPPELGIDALLRAHQQDSKNAWLQGAPWHCPEYVLSRIGVVYRFRMLRAYLLSEMALCEDTSLTASAGDEYCNRNILETIDQILRIEEQELQHAIRTWNPAAAAVPAVAAVAAPAPTATATTTTATTTATTSSAEPVTAVAEAMAATSVDDVVVLVAAAVATTDQQQQQPPTAVALPI